MNYYIDFDNTLYNTPLLVKHMLNSIANSAYIQKNVVNNHLLKECEKLVHENSFNTIYDLVNYISKKYSLDKKNILFNLNNVILNGKDFVFEDSIPFLEKLHENNKVFLLTHAVYSIDYQSSKIIGSKLANYFDAVYITSIPKHSLDIDYSNGIFIDDNPDVLTGLHSKNPKKIIRLRRPENKYSKIELNFNIPEYSSFSEIKI